MAPCCSPQNKIKYMTPCCMYISTCVKITIITFQKGCGNFNMHYDEENGGELDSGIMLHHYTSSESSYILIELYTSSLRVRTFYSFFPD